MIEGTSACGCGALFWASCCAALLDAATVLEAFVRPLMLGAAIVGTPVLVPATVMLVAFNTTSAARFRFPDTRIPASPALIVPFGAIRATSAGGTPATSCRTPIPPPVARQAKSVSTSALCGSIKTRVGGAANTVLEEEPAAISPTVDQIISLPPRSVNMRDVPTFTLL